MAMTQSWTDGVASVQQDGRTVTVRILGDVYRRQYRDEGEAAVIFDAERLAQEMMAAEIQAHLASLPQLEDWQ